jgi:NAD(P)-dependent dehydrogenase (short-subunit alcohol dehydrogenase family)
MRFNANQWSVIIGASGGIGMAAAEKLAKHGMNLCLIHRDRRRAMADITARFEKLSSQGVSVVTYNMDALDDANRKEILDDLTEKMGPDGRVRMILHALALGNLKPLAPVPRPEPPDAVLGHLASLLGRTPLEVKAAVDEAFRLGDTRLHPFIDPAFAPDDTLDASDFRHTLHSMGTNIVEWVQDLLLRKIFTDDARVLTLTSEGNQVAWRGYAAISAAKAVLESVSRSMAVEFAPWGIRSNVIQAGVTDTAALRMIPGNEGIRARAGLRNPLGRLTLPTDVADVICLLCSDEAAWINGALIAVDGGERIA